MFMLLFLSFTTLDVIFQLSNKEDEGKDVTFL